MEADAVFQDETREVHTRIFEKLDCLSDKTEGLASKADIAELKHFMQNINVGIGIFKFTWDNAAKIGSFLMLIGGVFLFIKYGAAAFFAWVLSGFQR